jgi:hypothetical protein
MQMDDDIIDHDIPTRVLTPADQANTWCVSDQVGIVESLSIGRQLWPSRCTEKERGMLDGTLASLSSNYM